jgi:putative ABC transport system permease protein
MLLDLRHALRLHFRAPGFTAAAVLTLALGVGANVAVFTFVDAVLFRPLPFPEPDRLVMLSESHPETGQDRVGVLPGTFLDWRERSQSLEAVALIGRASFVVTSREEPVTVAGATVSPGFFEVLGARPEIGHLAPATHEAIMGRERQVLISHRLWQRWFGGDPGAVGQPIEVQGGVHLTIAGVLPATFDFPRGAEIWHTEAWDLSDGRGERWLDAVARLGGDVSIHQAADELRRISAQIAMEFPDSNAGWTATIDPLAVAIVGPVRPALVAMLAAVALVFLIACVNVATLVVQRGVGRSRELAMRAALGASRARLMRQSLVEQGLLAVAGTAVGGLVALYLLDALVALAPAAIPRLDTVAIDHRVVAYLLCTAVAVLLLTGAAPAWRASRAEAMSALRIGPGGSSGAGAGGRGLVVAELALAVVLVAGAGLMVRTLVNLQRVDPGFEPAGVLSAELGLPISRMLDGPLEVGARPAWDRLVHFYAGLVEETEALPGVERAALVSSPPRARGDAMWLARPGLVPPTADGSPEWRPVQRRVISPAYFEVLRLPLVRGRTFTSNDHALEFLRAGTSRRRGAVIVNQQAARRLWPGEDALGRTLTIDGDRSVDGRVVVGIAGDARDEAPDIEPAPVVYLPFAESPAFSATLLARTTEPAPAPSAIRARLRAADPVLTIGEVRPLGESHAAALAPRRFVTVVLLLFGGLGLAVAAVGLYGLVALSVARRTREIGIRIALGASWPHIRRLVVREAALLVGLGAVLGTAGAAAGTRVLTSQLVGVSPSDSITWVVTIGILAITGLTAAWLPARRAARVEPVQALRQE